jgi:hypothetical protein
MAGSFSVTISSLSSMHIGGNKRFEATEIVAAVDAALQKMVVGNLTSVTLYDRIGANVGTMSWTPVNTS